MFLLKSHAHLEVRRRHGPTPWPLGFTSVLCPVQGTTYKEALLPPFCQGHSIPELQDSYTAAESIESFPDTKNPPQKDLDWKSL